MGRGYRKHEPILPKVQRVELSTKNLWIRVIGLCVAIVIALVSFGAVIRNLLTPEAGWQAISVTNSETGCATQFVFNYNLGAGNLPTQQEYRQLSLSYTRSSDEAYQALSSHEIEHVLNLYTLNSHPNEAVAIDPILYHALETAAAEGSRYIYLAPAAEQYDSLFACEFDYEAELYDPAVSADAAEFCAEIARFASDPASVEVRLLGDNQAMLFVSEEYLSYARENEITRFLDFGWLKNAFILDHIAETMIEQGLTNGTISSFDGFSCALGGDDYSQNLFRMLDGNLRQTAMIHYTGPMSLICYRSFPILEMDAQLYHAYENGRIVSPYLGADGIAAAVGENLIVMDSNLGCARLAMRTLDTFAAETLEESHLAGLNWVFSMGTQLRTGGTAFTVEKLG